MNAVVDTGTATRDRLRALRRQAGRIDASHRPPRDTPSVASHRDTSRIAIESAPIEAATTESATPIADAAEIANAAVTGVAGERDGERNDERVSPFSPRTPPATQTIEDLRRLLRVRAPALALPPRALDRTLPGEEIAPGLRFVETLVLERPLPAALCGAFDRRDAFSTRDALFFDTETTGLAGGTGTRAFMIGAARWCDAGLRVRQWWITALAAERELLAAFAEEAKDDSILVSFNGKSYDAPLLAARYRLARLRNPLTGLAHVDLLHPSRRRYRGRWENCRLATLERRVLEVAREDDLPGSEAPAAWLRYLRGGDARDLRRVVDHNRQDLVSMAGLLLHLSATSEVETSVRFAADCADREAEAMLFPGGYEGPSFSHPN